jgi:hypothetical protein
VKERAPTGNDEAMSKLLQCWTVDAQLAPRFQDAVWQRIERAEAGARFWQRLVDRVEAVFARPALAGVYVAAFLFVGVIAGYLEGEGHSAHMKSDLRTRYVQTVDPYQMPR